MMKTMINVPEGVQHWEAYDKLYYNGEYEALITLQKDYVKKHPENIREQLLLADAYGYAGKHNNALKILKRLHKYDPFDTEYTHALVECLDHLERDPRLFQWKRKVVIFETADETVDWCYNYLIAKGASEDSFDLFFEMEVAGYVRFEEVKLIEYLRDDSRFRVQKVGAFDYPLIELQQWHTCPNAADMIL